jgi:predicted transcriptional regulator
LHALKPNDFMSVMPPDRIINRYVSSPFWTRERDALIRKQQTAGIPLQKVAAQLGVTPNSVIRRSYHLRGDVPPYQWSARELRKKSAKLRKEKERRQKKALVAMSSAIKSGVPRDAAIAQAAKKGAGIQALAKHVGVTRQTIYRILVLQGASERELRVKAAKRRKEKERETRSVLMAMRAAMARGVPRDIAIAKARKAGVTYQAIADEVGLTRQRLFQIMLMQP